MRRATILPYPQRSARQRVISPGNLHLGLTGNLSLRPLLGVHLVRHGMIEDARILSQMKITIENDEGIPRLAQTFNGRGWLKQGTWPGSFLWFAGVLEGFSGHWSDRVLGPGLDIQDYACIGQPHGAFDCLIGASSFSDIRVLMEKDYSKVGPSYFETYAALCETKFGEWLAFSRKIAQRSDLAAIEDHEVKDLLEGYLDLLRENATFMDTIIVLADLLGDVVGGEVRSLLESNGVDASVAFGMFLEINSAAPPLTNTRLFEETLAELASRVRQQEPTLELFNKWPLDIETVIKTTWPQLFDEIDRCRIRFGWLNTYSFLGQPYTTNNILEFIKENLGKAGRTPSESHSEGENTELRHAIESLKVPNTLSELLKATGRLSYVNAAKDDAHQMSWDLIRPLTAEVARRLQCELDELLLLTPDELIEGVATRRLDRTSIFDRSRGWALVKIGNALHIAQGASHLAKLVESLNTILPENVSVLAGKPAYGGKVRGRARLVLTSADCEKVQEGDILVATNTSPDFIPAMRRAAAFVTDTGNLISHAVIAAREFKKTCVISTQVATQILQDGEWLEVDGTAGVVTRLDRPATS